MKGTGETLLAGEAPSQLGAHIYTGFADIKVTGYAVDLDLENKQYDGCLTDVVKVAENMDVVCDCPSAAASNP